jgi:hypothetical protein
MPLTIFAKVDVELRDDERAVAAAEAMATWTWCLLWTRAKERDGFVHRTALRNAWVGEKLAQRHMGTLVEVGLAVAVQDGWELTGYAEINDTKQDITDRREGGKKRKRDFDDRNRKAREALKAQEERESNSVGNTVGNALLPHDSQRGSSTEVEVEVEVEEEGESAGARAAPPLGLKKATPDPMLADAFKSGLLSAGHAVQPAAVAWKDLSAAAATHWPNEPAPKRLGAVRDAAERWARSADEKTRNGGFKHWAFIDWLNAGNAVDPSAERRAKRAVVEAEHHQQKERERERRARMTPEERRVEDQAMEELKQDRLAEMAAGAEKVLEAMMGKVAS